jgi:hypothetical protein
MGRGKIRIKTLVKALAVCYGSIDKNRILTVDEIIQTIKGKRANAYNYQRFLRKLFPEGPFDDNRPVGDEQRCLM